MPVPDAACLALIRQTADYLRTHHATFLDGRVTQLAGTAPVRETVALLDAAALAGDVAATKAACRALILTWRQLLRKQE